MKRAGGGDRFGHQAWCRTRFRNRFRGRLPGLVVLLALLLAGCMGSQNRPLQLVSGAGPIYPPEARAAGLQGDVVVRYDVSVEGRVTNARVDQADPAGVFDQAALAAIRAWRYNPQIREGAPEAVANVVSTVRFRLDDDDYYDQY